VITQDISEIYQDFYQDFYQDILHEANTEESSDLLENVFTRLAAEVLNDVDEIEGIQICHHFNSVLHTKLNGYFFNEDGDSVDLFVSLFKNSNEIQEIKKNEAFEIVNSAKKFFEISLKDLYTNLEEASDEFDAALGIKNFKMDLLNVRIILFTNGLLRNFKMDDDKIEGIDIEYQIWDLDRLFKLETSSNQREKTRIDISKYMIECLNINSSENYSSYFSILPACVLAEIYDKYGSRLLEKNVRAFLQVKGVVNTGIKNTIEKEPDYFLAYNNGISATASNVEIIEKEGRKYLQTLDDLQIVNGGQTTASIHHAFKKAKADISQIYIQTKITKINDSENMDEIVKSISKYANTQNKVQIADFSANDPFHRRLEELSRTVWAPTPDNSTIMRKWFYERARGQYHDGRIRNSNFNSDFPKDCLFTKTDIAKYEYSWEQKPDIVSKGAQKCFSIFTNEINLNRKKYTDSVVLPDDKYYKNLVAKAILFKSTEKIVRDQKFPGYNANIVTYTVAFLSFLSHKSLDMDKIWKVQTIDPKLILFITNLSHKVRQSIIESANGENVTQYCKKRICWENVQKINLEDKIPDIFITDKRIDMLNSSNFIPEHILINTDIKTQVISQVPSTVWFDIAKWSKEANRLQPWERSLCFSIGKLLNNKRALTPKQLHFGVKILKESSSFGFALVDEIMVMLDSIEI